MLAYFYCLKLLKRRCLRSGLYSLPIRDTEESATVSHTFFPILNICAKFF